MEMGPIYALVLLVGLVVLTPPAIILLARESELSGRRQRARKAAARDEQIRRMAARGGGRVVVGGQAYCHHGNVLPAGQGVYCDRCLQEGLDSMDHEIG